MPKLYYFLHNSTSLSQCKCFVRVTHPGFVLQTRGIRYKKSGGLIGGRKKRLPFNWRDLNFNPARIPSAWKPENWEEKSTINYRRKQELEKYIPGYKAPIPNHLQEDYQEELLYNVDKNMTLTEGLKQAMYLTKSVIADKGLPSKITELANAASTPDQDDQAIQVFQHARLFDIDHRYLDKHRKRKIHQQDFFDVFTKPDRYAPLIMKELIRLCETKSCQLSEQFYNRMPLEGIQSTACFYRESPTLDIGSISYSEKRWKLSMHSQANVQVQSKKPLPIFADQEAVQATENITLSSLYPVLPIAGIKTTNNYDFMNKTGILEKFSRPHLHTMAICNTQQKESNLIYADMLVNLFASLYSKAVHLYGDEPLHLPEPLTAQCVASDGRLFQFMCMQLNTTKLHSDDGIKNMIWVDNESIKDELYNIDDAMTPFAMYEECSHLTWKSPNYYLDYNPEVFKLFQGFWLNGVL